MMINRIVYNKNICHSLYFELVNHRYNFDTMNERLSTYKRFSDLKSDNYKIFNENYYVLIKTYNNCKEEINSNSKNLAKVFLFSGCN